MCIRDRLPTDHIIKKTFDTWESRGWVETTHFKLQSDYETAITFKLQDTQNTKSKSIEIEKPESGFILPEYSDNQKQADSYR